MSAKTLDNDNVIGCRIPSNEGSRFMRSFLLFFLSLFILGRIERELEFSRENCYGN